MALERQHPIAEGQITCEGIGCNCCGKVYLGGFEVHACSNLGSLDTARTSFNVAHTIVFCTKLAHIKVKAYGMARV